MSAGVAKPESDYPSVGAANYGVVLLFFAYVLSFLDRNILSLLIGPIREQFGITDFQYSLLAGAAFALVYSFASLPLGRLADHYSRKLIVAGSVAFWSVATAARGLANGVGQLFASRMAVGAGEAGLAPPAYSIITDSYRPAHFGYAMSFYKTGVRVGSSMLAMAGYGSSAWYPEFLIRNYGLSRGAAGLSYGAISIVTGVLGIMVAPWIANRLAARGYKDAYVRTLLATTMIATPPSVAAPLAGSATLTLLLLVPAMVFSGADTGTRMASKMCLTTET